MDFEEVVTGRRSVHEYSDRELDDGTLAGIFERARFAPSSFNLQPWEFLVVREEEPKRRLAEAANGQEHVADAAASVVVLGNLDPSAHAEPTFEDQLRKGYIPDEETKGHLLDTVEGMAGQSEDERRLWTVRSSALAAMAVMNAAWDQGVASCPVGGFDPDAVAEAFDVGDGYEPVLVVTLGYPAEDAADVENERKYRRSVDEIVHHESFDPVEEADLPRADVGPSTGATATDD